jgi:PAP2 superfamily
MVSKIQFRTPDKLPANLHPRYSQDITKLPAPSKLPPPNLAVQEGIMEKWVTAVRACVFALMGSAVAAFSPDSSVFAQQTPAIGTVSPRGDAVIAWSANAGVAATKACITPLDSPFHESRLYAIMHIAIHDALNAVDRRYRPYVLDQSVAPGASPDAAVAAAAHDVLVPLLKQLPHELVAQSCIDAGVISVEADYSAALAAIPNSAAKTQGIALGQAAATAILAKRASDGAVGPFLNPNCPQNAKPGEYQCIPGTPVTVFEAWEKVTPFVLQDSAQFRPGPPYTVNEQRYTADFNEVKRLGGDGSMTPSSRTADQTEIALFWYESSPLKWSRIARAVSLNKRLDMWENARLLGLLNMALADGYIAMVATKNHYNYWRPVTAIQAGATDGNPDTPGDKTWTPLRPTPPDQDYASGHAIEGGAAAEVLKQFFGTDQISFRDCGVTLPAGSTCSDPSPVVRSFTSFSQAADENAYSRVLIGFHFRKSIEEGTAYGRKIGERAVALYLRPAG